MIASKQLIAQLAFVKYADNVDSETFEDYDSNFGLNACVYTELGIVCNIKDEQQYIDIMIAVAGTTDPE